MYRPIEWQRAAQEPAAREREQRIAVALARLARIDKIKKAQGKPVESAGGSTAVAEAVIMKMVGLTLNLQPIRRAR